MENFTYANPVKIIFGKDTIKFLKDELANIKNAKVLMLYGGGSIKRNGVYEQAKKALDTVEWFEFGNLEPNPHFETCIKAVSVIKKNNINFLLAIGGGSVIDATKFIAAAACFEGADAWDILKKHAPIKQALPFGTILTLPATGSEMNNGAVITKASSSEKLSFASPLVFPKFSILDPTTTYTLPQKQISNGIVDTFVHTTEQYLNYREGSALIQDFMSEGILKTLIIEGPKALKNPEDYDVRANLMWSSTWALNYWIGCGVPGDWATHVIGHELTAFYGLDHAQTLAIILPGVLQIMKKQKMEKLVRMAKEVFHISTSNNDMALADMTINNIEKFFNDIHVKTKLSDYGIDAVEAASKIEQRMEERNWKLGECQNITPAMVKEIILLRK